MLKFFYYILLLFEWLSLDFAMGSLNIPYYNVITTIIILLSLFIPIMLIPLELITMIFVFISILFGGISIVNIIIFVITFIIALAFLYIANDLRKYLSVLEKAPILDSKNPFIRVWALFNICKLITINN